MTKKELRKEILEKRGNLSKEDYNYKNNLICNNVEKFLNTFSFKSIALYYPFRNEVSLLPVAEKLIKNKTVSFPKVSGKNMDFIKISSMNDFAPGVYGINEPFGDTIIDIDIFLVPAVGFDKSFYRLGYGGGYYDRYFASHKKTILAGIGFELQLTDKIPHEDYDITMNYIITENGIMEA